VICNIVLVVLRVRHGESDDLGGHGPTRAAARRMPPHMAAMPGQLVRTLILGLPAVRYGLVADLLRQHFS